MEHFENSRSLSDVDKQRVNDEIRNIVAFLNRKKPRNPSILGPLLEFLVLESIAHPQQPPTQSEIANHFRIDEERARQRVGQLRYQLTLYGTRGSDVKFSIPGGQYGVQFEFGGVKVEERSDVQSHSARADRVSSGYGGNSHRFVEMLLIESIIQQVSTGKLWWEKAKTRKLAQESRHFLREVNAEIISGQLEIVVDWLERAKRHGLAEAGTQLFLTEGCLARIMGKRRAEGTLREISTGDGTYNHRALLELLTLRFAAHRLPPPIDSPIIQAAISAASERGLHRAILALLAVWHLSVRLPPEKSTVEAARSCLNCAFAGEVPEEHNSTTDPQPLDYSYAIPRALAYLACDDGASAEKHLDLIWNGRPAEHEEYPFTLLTYEMDRTFLETCIGKRDIEEIELPERFIRELKGHAWLLLQYIRFLLTNDKAKSNLVKKTKLANHIKDQELKKRLLTLESKLVAVAGEPW